MQSKMQNIILEPPFSALNIYANKFFVGFRQIDDTFYESDDADHKARNTAEDQSN